jgi:hypothetical protein
MYAGKFPSNFIDEAESITNFSMLISLGSIPDRVYAGALKFSTSERSLDTCIFGSEVVNPLMMKARSWKLFIRGLRGTIYSRGGNLLG